jgi:acyl-CoA oxidase
LTEQKKINIGKLGLGKAWITKRIREAAALGREMLGGNGIVSDNHVMRAFCDMEAIFTYEGSYDINSLVAGRELTGYSAFK